MRADTIKGVILFPIIFDCLKFDLSISAIAKLVFMKKIKTKNEQVCEK